jgi:hypothetical protein
MSGRTELTPNSPYIAADWYKWHFVPARQDKAMTKVFYFWKPDRSKAVFCTLGEEAIGDA